MSQYHELIYFECMCKSLDHLMRLSYFCDEPDIAYLETHLTYYKGIVGFFKRIWRAIKYIFGYKCRYGEFDEFLLDFNTMIQFRDEIDKLIKMNEEKSRDKGE